MWKNAVIGTRFGCHKKVPNNAIIVGNPARFIKYADTEKFKF